MQETELITKYTGWSLRDIQDLSVRARRFWSATAIYRLNTRGN